MYDVEFIIYPSLIFKLNSFDNFIMDDHSVK
jgi:hypothetical protein